MKQTLKRFLLVIAAVVTISIVSAQNKTNPVSWRINYKMTSSTEGEAIITATISDGWHLYGMNLPKGGPKPTTIDLSKSTGLKFTGDLVPSIAPSNYQDEMFNMSLQCWTKKVTFRRRFKITDKAKAKLSATISFMSCNNQNCSMPTTETLSKIVK